MSPGRNRRSGIESELRITNADIKIENLTESVEELKEEVKQHTQFLQFKKDEMSLNSELKP